jgi:hypothetical protein
MRGADAAALDLMSIAAHSARDLFEAYGRAAELSEAAKDRLQDW